MLFYVLLVCKCVLYYCHRVTTQLQLTNVCYNISYNIATLVFSFFHSVSNYIYVGLMVVMKDSNMREPLRKMIHTHVS